MKADIYNGITAEGIVKRAPSILKEEIKLRRLERIADTFTLLVFPIQRKDVVLSGAVRHVLAGITSAEPIVALAGCFTWEALALLKERNVEAFTQSDESWSDESWQNIRNVISSPVKNP
jgi:hypothetical protein